MFEILRQQTKGKLNQNLKKRLVTFSFANFANILPNRDSLLDAVAGHKIQLLHRAALPCQCSMKFILGSPTLNVRHTSI